MSQVTYIEGAFVRKSDYDALKLKRDQADYLQNEHVKTIVHLRTELEDYRKGAQAGANACDKANSEARDLKHKLEVAINQRDAFEKAVENYRKCVADLEAKLAAANAELEKTKECYETAAADYAFATGELAQLREQVEQGKAFSIDREGVYERVDGTQVVVKRNDDRGMNWRTEAGTYYHDNGVHYGIGSWSIIKYISPLPQPAKVENLPVLSDEQKTKLLFSEKTITDDWLTGISTKKNSQTEWEFNYGNGAGCYVRRSDNGYRIGVTDYKTRGRMLMLLCALGYENALEMAAKEELND